MIQIMVINRSMHALFGEWPYVIYCSNGFARSSMTIFLKVISSLASSHKTILDEAGLSKPI